MRTDRETAQAHRRLKHMRNPPKSLFWPLQLGGWLALYIGLLAGTIHTRPLAYAMAEKSVTVVLGLVLTTALHPAYRYLFRRGVEPAVLLGVTLVASYVGSFVWNAGYVVIYGALVAPHFGTTASKLSEVGFLSSIFNAPYLLAWGLLYFAIKYYHALVEERERSLRAQVDAHQARLRALRYQLNPHFLFNTMNAISTLVVEEKNRDATLMISRLSDFLRMTLYASDAPQVSLAEELDFARRYLEIEQIRFGDRLAVQIDAADDTLSVRVPALILQPLVENAIKYAVSPNEDGGCIAILARRTDEGILLRITDDGAGRDLASDPSPGGIGLANTRERLRQLYGDRQRLELEPSPSGGLTVSIHVPGERAGPILAATPAA